MKHNIFQSLKTIALAILLSFGLSYVYAWTAPTVSAPNGNVSAPINTSTTNQVKNGGLAVTNFVADSAIISGVSALNSASTVGNLIKRNAADQTIVGEAAFGNDMKLQTGSGGNILLQPGGGNVVGIRTSNPKAVLSVGDGSVPDGNVPLQMSTGGAGTMAYYGANKNGNYGYTAGFSNGDGALGGFVGGVTRMISADPYAIFVNNTTQAMTVLNNGNVGIGTATPAQKLSVAGTIESTSGGIKFPDTTVQKTAAASFSAHINWTGSVLSQSPSDWVQSSIRSGIGWWTLGFNSSYFPSAPNCVCTGQHSTIALSCQLSGGLSSSGGTFLLRNISGGVAVDSDWYLACFR